MPRLPLPRSRRTRRTRRAAAVGLVAAALIASATTQVASSSASSASGPEEDAFRPQLVTVETSDRAAKQRLQGLGLDLTEHAGHDYVEVVLHTPADLAALESGGFAYDVRIPDMVARGVEIAEINEAYAAEVSRSALPSGRTSYRFYDDYVADMAGLQKRYPGLVRNFRLKRPTLDGRAVRAIEIGGNIRYRNPAKPTFLLMGAHHAREWPSAELAMEFAMDLAQSYGKNERITRLLNRARVIVVPVVNVDGFTYSRQDGEYVDLREVDGGGTATVLGTPGRAYMRKNCRFVDGQDNPDGSCAGLATTPGAFGPGVDLNRNYGGFWGGPGASDLQADPTYRGAGAFSEPETQNIQDLIRTEQITMLISNHTYSNLVLRPNGVNPLTVAHDGKPVGDAPDEEGLKRLGARMTAQNGYANIHGWQLYDTTGTTEDYSYNATGGYGYTFEIGPDEFHPPFPDVVGEYLGTGRYAGQGNRAAYLIALEHAVDTDYSGRLVGDAPRGAVVRLRKDFRSPTWESSFKDFVDTSFVAAGSGEFSWIVNPSTRPVVQPRPYQELAKTPFDGKKFEELTPPPNSHTDLTYVASKPSSLLDIKLDWPTPDDLDLEVYRKVGGELVQVGSSGTFVGEKERVTISQAPAGTYVIRVINFASTAPTYTVDVGQFNATTRYTEGRRESYTLTCERKNGTVLQSMRVYLERGQRREVDLTPCRRRY